MSEKEQISNPEAEIQPEPSVETGRDTPEQESQSSPEEALARFSREIASRSGAPLEASGGAESAEEDEDRELKSAFDVAMERAGEPSEEDVAAREARGAEQEAGREQRIEEIAGELLAERMDGRISYETVDKFLADNNIEPWTPESAKFMEAWDLAQARTVYEQTTERFDEAIASSQEQIEKLEKQTKKASYKGKAAKLEGAIMAHEAKIKELEEKKNVFACSKPEVSPVAPSEPEPAAEAPQSQEQPEAVAESAEAAPVPDASESEPAVAGTEAEGEEDIQFAPGQELWYRDENGAAHHAWIKSINEGGGNNWVLEERDAAGKVTASYSHDSPSIVQNLLSEQEGEAYERQALEQAEPEEPEKGDIFEVRIPGIGPKTVQVVKTPGFFRRKFEVEDVDENGVAQKDAARHKVDEKTLLAGKKVEQAPDEERREAA